MTELRDWVTFVLICVIAAMDTWLVFIDRQIMQMYRDFLLERRKWYAMRLAAKSAGKAAVPTAHPVADIPSVPHEEQLVRKKVSGPTDEQRSAVRPDETDSGAPHTTVRDDDFGEAFRWPDAGPTV